MKQISVCIFLILSLLTVLRLSPTDATEAKQPNNALVLRCDWFDRGNAIVGTGYSTKYNCLINGGEKPNFVEYDLHFPATGKYRIDGLYTAEESRPVTVLFDGKPLGDFFRQTTGSWQSNSARWFTEFELTTTAGKHLLRLQQPNCFPHLCALRITPTFETDQRWAVPRATARTRAIEQENVERELPWNIAWFAPVAYDRRAKKESGQLFEDHFGPETAVALYSPGQLNFSVQTAKDLQTQKYKQYDPLNELTYRASVFQSEKSRNPFDPFFVQVELKKDLSGTGQTINSALRDGTIFRVGSDRYRLLISKTEKLAQKMEHEFGWDELLQKGFQGGSLEQILERCRQEQKKLDLWQKELAQKNLTEDAAKKIAASMTSSFFQLIVLYWQIGMANPLLDFNDLLYVRRENRHLGLPQNWESNSVLPVSAFNDSLWQLKMPKLNIEKKNGNSQANSQAPNIGCLPETTLFFKPKYPTFLGDLDLHFDADRVLFSSTNDKHAWNVYEISLKGTAVDRNTKTEKSTEKSALNMKAILPVFQEANNYDACYLADDSILFNSSACYAAVPCVNGSTRITNLFRRYNDGSVRRLTFDQEHNWCPTMTADGRIMYLRWEYTDAPHVPARLLFQMNPDGTNQMAMYGSNSYWPNSMFYARPIPGEPSRFIAVVGGHHGVQRMGELTLFDVKQGRKETQGAVMRICAKEKKVASRTNPKYDDSLIVDNLVDEAWPKFLHPYPLSSSSFLVASQPTQNGNWGIYLVDDEDNMFLLAQENGFACFEPTPIRKTERPPVLVDRTNPKDREATVFLADIYVGDGLKNVPRGTVKQLRLITYNYLFPNMGGPQGTVGIEGPWDIKQVIGSVPVSPEGAAMFKVPANTPLAIQPLDENGKELQLMRSWFTAMPGETLSCIGCHEDVNTVSPNSLDPKRIAKTPLAKVTPWYGPTRGFSFTQEVQPVLDRYCTACHDGSVLPNGKTIFDLRGLKRINDYSSVFHSGTRAGHFSTSYVELARYVRRPGMESDYHLLMPTEFSPETTELYRHLRKGHAGLKLDAEAWDRILTWIDLNAPFYGSWSDQTADPAKVEHWNKLRKEILQTYANVLDDQEKIQPSSYLQNGRIPVQSIGRMTSPVNPLTTPTATEPGNKSKMEFPDAATLKQRAKTRTKIETNSVKELNWTFDSKEAKRRQEECAEQLFGDRSKTEKIVELAPNVTLKFVLIPPGTFVMGAQSNRADGSPLCLYQDESPCNVTIDRPFWMGTLEISNKQFELFDPSHDSGVESRYAMQFGVRGFYVNAPELPVVRVSWKEANSFCAWLAKKSGLPIRLPTEAQWEYACRAGTATPFYFGGLDSDFSSFENLADRTLREFVCHPYFKERKPIGGSKYDQWAPRDDRFDDKGFLSEKSGRYRANPWGLFDMHGNVSEWTGSLARPYPYREDDGRNNPEGNGERIVRGGSWRDRPLTARSEYRWYYRPWQGVFNVGFRVICDINSKDINSKDINSKDINSKKSK